MSLNGYPSKLLSDNGTQQVTAITKTWDWKKFKQYGVMEGLQRIFTPADAPWQNGVTEALIRSVKRAIEFSFGKNALTFSELQPVLFEIANLLNERLIGRHRTSPEEPQAGYQMVHLMKMRIPENVSRSSRQLLIPRKRWHTSHRNLKIGDVVLIQDSN